MAIKKAPCILTKYKAFQSSNPNLMTLQDDLIFFYFRKTKCDEFVIKIWAQEMHHFEWAMIIQTDGTKICFMRQNVPQFTVLVLQCAFLAAAIEISLHSVRIGKIRAAVCQNNAAVLLEYLSAKDLIE